MADQTKVKFVEDYEVQAEAGEKFKEGKTYTMSEASAAHHVSRGRAEYVVAKGK